jgi:hypothetical protein
LLLVLAPGYRTSTGALAKRPALRRARRLIERAAPGDAVRARLALAAIVRLEALEDECAQLEGDVKAALMPLQPTRLLAICGVGALTAAKLLGEIHSVDRFASAAALPAHTGTAPIPISSGNTQRHRLSAAATAIDQLVGGLLDPQPLGQGGGQQQARVGDGVGVVEGDVELVQGVGGLHRESALLVGEAAAVAGAILPAQRAFLIIGPAPLPLLERCTQAK